MAVFLRPTRLEMRDCWDEGSLTRSLGGVAEDCAKFLSGGSGVFGFEFSLVGDFFFEVGVEPGFGSGVVFEIGVPEGGGEFEDEGLEFFALGCAGCAAHGGEGHVVGAGEVEEEGVGLRGVVEGGSAGAGADHAEFVVGAGEVEHGDFDGVEGGVLVEVFGAGAGHGDAGFDAGVGEVEIFGGVVLAGDGLGGDGAEGVAGHADFGEVEVGGERGEVGGVGFVGVECFELIDEEVDVGDAVEEGLEVFAALEHGEHFWADDGGVGADVLWEEDDVAVGGPLGAVGAVGFAGAAEAVGEEDDGEFFVLLRPPTGVVEVFGEDDEEGDVAVAGGVVPGLAEFGDFFGGNDGGVGGGESFSRGDEGEENGAADGRG